VVTFGATRRLAVRLPPPTDGSPSVGDYLATRPDRVAAAAFPPGAVTAVAPGVFRAALPALNFFVFALAPTADVRVAGAPTGDAPGGGRLELHLVDWELGERGGGGGDGGGGGGGGGSGGGGGLVGAYGGWAAMKELVRLSVSGDLTGVPPSRAGGDWQLRGEVRLTMDALRLLPPLSLLPRGVVEGVGRGVAEAVLGGVSGRLGDVIVDDYADWAAEVRAGGGKVGA